MTRRRLAELLRDQRAGAIDREQGIERARHMLARKRTIKAQVRRERRAYASGDETAGADILPIEVRDQGEYVHFPASEADVRAVLRSLPPGSLSDLSRIVLCLGMEYQRHMVEADEDWGEPDPLVGRLGLDIMPNIYAGVSQGTYVWDDASIWLYAYVYDGALPQPEPLHHYLRLQMLATLMHEIAHHDEATRRDGRGRWSDRPDGRREWFAREHEHTWTLRYVVPYLDRTYPEATRSLEAWVAHNGGIPIPLSGLIDGPHEHMFTTAEAVEALFTAAHESESLRDRRFGFAHDLRLAGRYDTALRVVTAILAEYPDDSAVRVLQARIYVDLRRFDEAEEIASAVVAVDPACGDAWKVLLEVYRARGAWRALDAVASRLIEQPDRHARRFALLDRACARIELSDFAGAAADIDETAGYRDVTRVYPVESLRALLLLRTGRYEESLCVARNSLQRLRGRFPWRGVLLAVRFEAAQRLGRPRAAGRLSRRAAALLRDFGFSLWVDRLVSSNGLP